MTVIRLRDIAARELVKGFKVRFVHSGTMTFAYWDIEKGASLPDHHHPHEQVVNMIEGEFILRMDGTPYRLSPGEVLVIPPNVPHSGEAVTDARILDVFHPVREDYR